MERAYQALTGEAFKAGPERVPPANSGIIEQMVGVLTAADHTMTVGEIFDALSARGVTTTVGTVKQVANRAARRKRILRPEPGRFTVDRQVAA